MYRNDEDQPEVKEQEKTVVCAQDTDLVYCAICNTRCDSICAEARKKRGILVCPELISYFSANPRMKPKKKRFGRRDRDEGDQFES